MSNIIGYVKNYRQTFDQKGFNQADALVLSWLSYFNYIDDLKGKASLSINQIKEKYLLSSKEMYKDAFLPKSSDKLFTLMKSSPRFSNLILSDFRLIKDYRECEQYASITIQISPDLFFVSFRGTDPSFLGWEEDFRLSYMASTPSQKEGLKHLKEEMEKHPQAKFILGGHSKVGNTSIYAGALLNEEEQKRIISIYSFDGPGFPSGFLKNRAFYLSYLK